MRPQDVVRAARDAATRTELPWLQPFPDRLLDPAVTREPIELAFLAACARSCDCAT
jgi:hypothetical protein